MSAPSLLRGALSVIGLTAVIACSDHEEPQQATLPVIVGQGWSRPEGMLASSRYRHTATTLLDGKVLIVGGASEVGSSPGVGSAPLATAELFNSTLQVFEPVGPLVHARWGHTATLLRDGRVLIAGGVDESQGVIAAAELYDPTTKAFMETTSAEVARALHTATLLPDDRVLILGGTDDPEFGSVVAAAELYSPDLDAFDAVGHLPAASFPHAAVLMGDGRVAVVSPDPASGGPSFSLTYFDPNSDDFSPNATAAGTFAICSQSPGCADILLDVEQPDRFNIITGRGELQLDLATGALSWPAEQAPAVAFFDESLTGASATMTSAMGRANAPVPLGSDGPRPLLAGGWLNEEGSSLTNERLVGVDGTRYWVSSSMVSGRAWPTATTLVDGEVLVTGGLGDTPLKSIERRAVPPASSPVTNLGAATGRGHAATLLADGRILFSGGYEQSTTLHAWQGRVTEAVSGDFDDSGLEPAGRMLVRRGGHQALLLPSGAVLLAAGETEPFDANEELFDPISGTSSDLGFRLRARQAGLAVADERIIFASEAGLQLVNPNDWSVRSVAAPEPLDCPTPTLARLASGRVLVVGSELLFELDPQTGDIAEPVALAIPRCGARAATLPDGSVVLVGGTASPDSLDRFDPSTGNIRTFEDVMLGGLGSHPVVRFSRVWFLGGQSLDSTAPPHLMAFDWASESFDLAVVDDGTLPVSSTTQLPMGGVLLVSEPGPGFSQTSRRVDLFPMDSADLALGVAPLEVTAGMDVELTDLPFSKTWPERSGGTTAGSATNLPVAIWIPALDGWPLLGTFTRWSEDRATWRVPHAPLPGLGVLGYSLSGTFHPLRLVRIQASSAGRACIEGGECQSGYCVDAVCCKGACDLPCEACTAARKGAGEDGSCGPIVAGSEDVACEVEDVKTCGRNGLCDGTGQCASFPDGESCAAGAVCQEGVCVRGGDAPTCDGDHLLIGPSGDVVEDCGQYRCSSATNVCLVRCTTNVDCSDGDLCDSQQRCRAPFAGPRTSVGCAPGCAVASRRQAQMELWSLLVALAGVHWRRTRRARAATIHFAP